MKLRPVTWAAILAPTVLSLAPRSAPVDIVFRKLVIDKRFVSEGVAVGDLNRDGRLDILAGNVWYEAPDWTPHGPM